MTRPGRLGRVSIKKQVGSGGRGRKALEGRGPTPRAEDRVYHKAYRAKADDTGGTGRAGAQPRSGVSSGRFPAGSRGRNDDKSPRNAIQPSKSKPAGAGAEWVVGRNPVLEALRAGLPVRTLYAVEGAERDARLREIFAHAAEHSLPMLAVTRLELDKLTGGAVHQGVALRLPSFLYADADELLDDALVAETDQDALLVALDGITDPHNLGAIIRSAAAFGAHGVVIPSRRSAEMTAASWKASAGAAARIPVAKTGNLNQFVDRAKRAGYVIVGLAGDGEVDVADAPGVTGPTVLVVGAEGAGLSRLMRDRCDALASIPINGVESLNASVAAAIALYEVARARR